MSLNTIFTVKNEDLERLNPYEAVDFFRELIWAEATRIGIGKNLINVPSKITVADGGIDAEVTNKISDSQGLIKKGLNRFQIKTGEFSLNRINNIQNILFIKVKGKRELKPKVKSCLDRRGVLVIVLFGWDNPETTDDGIIQKFKDQLIKIDNKYSLSRIEIFKQNNIISILYNFPSLILKLKGIGNLPFQDFSSWARNAEMCKPFEAGSSQNEFIANISEELSEEKDAVHLRIWGEPGIGKTRLVLESLRSEHLSPLVIYCDSADKFKDSILMNELLRIDNKYYVILVIDECNEINRSYIWDRFKYSGSRIKIITIYNDLTETSGNIKYFNVDPLGNEQLCNIIHSYGIPNNKAKFWTDFCGGSPRVAHVLGQNLINNPEDLLKTPDTVNIWDRFITGYDNPNNDEVKFRRLVLQHVSLFKRFGFGVLINEAKNIWEMVKKVDPNLTWPKFKQQINYLKNRKILQGENTLYISPKALHIKLWTEWWENYGSEFNLNEFTEKLSSKLIDWFFEMFKYAAESKMAMKVVENLLGDKGLFYNGSFLKTKLGSGFFLSLTEANPKKALMCLIKTIGVWSKEELLNFTTGRREVIFALENIVAWKDLFQDGARLLLTLGEAENERYSNNASGIFAELFSPAPDPLAPTEASLSIRFPILKEAIESESKEKRMLAIRACNLALESQRFIRMISKEYQGFGKKPKLWKPETYGEIFNYYRNVWELLVNIIKGDDNDEQIEAFRIISRRSYDLLLIENLKDMVISTFEMLVQRGKLDRIFVLEEVIRIIRLRRDIMSKEYLQKWLDLRNSLEGDSFSSRLQRYVSLDLVDDLYDDQGNYSVENLQKKIDQLAKESFENRDLLIKELERLVKIDSRNVSVFGYKLGKIDTEFFLLEKIIFHQKKIKEHSKANFIGGYLRAISEKDRGRLEKILDSFLRNKQLKWLIPELSWRVGLTDRSAIRILEMANLGIVDVGSFRLFSIGASIKELSKRVALDVIKYLIGRSDIFALSIAIQLFYFYFIHDIEKLKIPKIFTMKLLFHRLFFKDIDFKKIDPMVDYHWAEIAKKYLVIYPEKSIDVAGRMLKEFGSHDSIFGKFRSQTEIILNEIAQNYPSELWLIIQKYLDPPLDKRALEIRRWIKEIKFLSLIPIENIWNWVDKDVDRRAYHLASFVPNYLSYKDGEICLARELLIRYGDRENVRERLRGNFSTEFWAGSASKHYEEKKSKFFEYQQQEENKNVLLWIEEYIDQLDKMIEFSKIEEERID